MYYCEWFLCCAILCHEREQWCQLIVGPEVTEYLIKE